MPEETPAPGGGVFVGPGGQAPPFAPGGPEEDTGIYTTTFYDSGGPLFPPPLSAVGGSGAPAINYPQVQQQSNPGLPGHGTTPGQFQPGGGMPQAGTLPTQRPGRQETGFLARIVPVSGDVSRIIPVSGGSVGGGPVMPPSIPGQPLPPTVGGGPIIPPSVGEPGFPTPPIAPVPPTEGGGPSQGKPRGLKTLPMPKDPHPPVGPPKPPGQWVTLDAGRGQPPAWAFIEDSGPGSDDGLEGVPTPKPVGGTTKPPAGGEKGHYVPVQMPYYVQPVSDGDDVTWAWVPTIDDSYGVKEPEPEPKPTK